MLVRNICGEFVRLKKDGSLDEDSCEGCPLLRSCWVDSPDRWHNMEVAARRKYRKWSKQVNKILMRGG